MKNLFLVTVVMLVSSCASFESQTLAEFNQELLEKKIITQDIFIKHQYLIQSRRDKTRITNEQMFYFFTYHEGPPHCKYLSVKQIAELLAFHRNYSVAVKGKLDATDPSRKSVWFMVWYPWRGKRQESFHYTKEKCEEYIEWYSKKYGAKSIRKKLPTRNI